MASLLRHAAVFSCLLAVAMTYQYDDYYNGNNDDSVYDDYDNDQPTRLSAKEVLEIDAATKLSVITLVEKKIQEAQKSFKDEQKECERKTSDISRMCRNVQCGNPNKLLQVLNKVKGYAMLLLGKINPKIAVGKLLLFALSKVRLRKIGRKLGRVAKRVHKKVGKLVKKVRKVFRKARRHFRKIRRVFRKVRRVFRRLRRRVCKVRGVVRKIKRIFRRVVRHVSRKVRRVFRKAKRVFRRARRYVRRVRTIIRRIRIPRIPRRIIRRIRPRIRIRRYRPRFRFRRRRRRWGKKKKRSSCSECENLSRMSDKDILNTMCQSMRNEAAELKDLERRINRLQLEKEYPKVTKVLYHGYSSKRTAEITFVVGRWKDKYTLNYFSTGNSQKTGRAIAKYIFNKIVR